MRILVADRHTFINAGASPHRVIGVVDVTTGHRIIR